MFALAICFIASPALGQNLGVQVLPAAPLAPITGFALPRLNLQPGSITLQSPKLGASTLPSVRTQAPSDPETQRALALMPLIQGLQSLVLQAASKRSGLDPLLLSLAMSAHRYAGINLGEYRRVVEELAAIDATGAEVAEALDHDLAHTLFASKMEPAVFRTQEGQDALMDLKMAAVNLASSVEILRNNRFLNWLDAWSRDGDKAVSFKDASVRKVGKAYQVFLGVAPGGERLIVTFHPEIGGGQGLSYHIDRLFSPSADAQQKQDLITLCRKLEAAGLLPAGYSASKR